MHPPWALLWIGVVLCTSSARAQSVDDRVLDLNVEAMEAYNEMDVAVARELLEQAQAIPGQSPQAQKRTYMNLAVVHIDGLASNGPGGEFMVAALCIDPDLPLDPLISTPNIHAAYTWARNQVATGRCGGGPVQVARVDSAGIGQPCIVDAECGAGLLCSLDGQCFAGGEGEQGDGQPGATLEPKRGMMFGRFGLALGASWITTGMVPDTQPTANTPTYTNNELGALVFTMPSPWQPDGDSADSMGVLSGCPADGKQTMAPEEPSSYCVGVKSSGLGAGFAFKLAGGYFVTDRISASVLLRWQPDSGEGTLSSVLIGGRAEYWLGALAVLWNTPIYGSPFAGLTFGQIQHQPTSNYDDGPYVSTGPIGMHAGIAFRFPLTPKYVLYAAPEIDILFPDFLFHLDFTLAGIEMYF